MKKSIHLYNLWNIQKQSIEFQNTPHVQIKKGEFWRYREGINIGSELSKDGNRKRPCLVLYTIPKTSLIVIAPCTTKRYAKHAEYLISLINPDKFFMKPCWFMLHQIKV